MIVGVVGLLGGGKSYHCVRLMCEAIKRGDHVATNLILRTDRIAKYLHLPIDVVQKRYHFLEIDEGGKDSDPWTWPRGTPRGRPGRKVVVCVDEAGEWMGIESQGQLRSYKSFLRQSDKRGQDVFLIVQDPSILMKQGRVLCQEWRMILNMAKWRIPGLGCGVPPPWSKQFRVDSLDRYGKVRLDRKWYPNDDYVRDCYYTDQFFGQKATDDLASIYEGDPTPEYEPFPFLEVAVSIVYTAFYASIYSMIST